jgi:hypothetical protein
MSIIHDGGIDREMTDEEIATAQAIKASALAQAEAQTDAQSAREVARQEVLDRLGLSATEVHLLLG